jgi:hypothetical protein
VKQRLFIFGGFILLILILIGLNAASFSRQNKIPDTEYNPNRSSYNSDATGTRAIYDLLVETGRKVTRWQEKPSVLLTQTSNRPSVFVIIGETRRDITNDDATAIMRWVSQGGRLVVIDRKPMEELVKTTASWQISTSTETKPYYSIDSGDVNALTNQTASLKPLQPTPYTRGVNAIKPSVLAAAIKIKYIPTDADKEPTAAANHFKVGEMDEEDAPAPAIPKTFNTPKPTPAPPPTPAATPTTDRPKGDFKISPSREDEYDAPPPTPKPTPAPSGSGSGIGSGPGISDAAPTESLLSAPVVHFANGDNIVMADFPFGKGEVVYLSDPFIVANNGLKLADNSQLAINILASSNGITAFDEYHQGFGKSDDRLAAYFEGTPVFAILAQLLIFFGLLFWSRGRRFARALPLGEPDRLSKLEYVTAMADIQQNIKAYDLAIENIYLEFRRNLTRFTGDDNTVSNENLATEVADRTPVNRIELVNLMNDCRAIYQGEATNKAEILKLAQRIREIENQIGIKRIARRKM